MSGIKKAVCVSLAVSSLAYASPASAENLFLLQLGAYASRESAAAEIQKLEASHSQELGQKRYILEKTRPLSGGETQWRILVGPFDTRKTVSRSCANLKQQGTDCFVVETAAIRLKDMESAGQFASGTPEVDAPSTTNDDDTTQAQASVASNDPAPATPSSSLFPWDWFDGDAASSSAQPATVAAKTATDQAARAAGSNININTQSIYAEKEAPAAQTPNLVDALSDLFTGEEKVVQAAVETKPDPEPKPATHVEPVIIEPIAELPKEAEPVAVKAEPALDQATIAAAPADAAPKTLPVTLPKATTPRVAEVQVSEAIPVPVTELEDVKVVISQPAPSQPANKPEAEPSFVVASKPQDQPVFLDIALPESQPQIQPQTQPEPQPAPTPTLAETAPTIVPPSVEPSAKLAAEVVEMVPEKTLPVALPDAAAEPAVSNAFKTAQAMRGTRQPVNTVAPTSRYQAAPAMAPQYRQPYQSSRLLQVSVFEDDRKAFHCISQVQANLPQAAMIRTRMIKSSAGNAVVRFGPVNDAQLEADICEAVASCNSELRCRVLTEQQPQPSVTERSRYQADAKTPTDLTPRSATLTPEEKANERLAAVKAEVAAKPAWVQLGTSSSESDAMDRFESLKEQHPDVLAAFQPTINTPDQVTMSGTVYRLRIGPFEPRSEAQRLCATLSSRGVGCLVLSR